MKIEIIFQTLIFTAFIYFVSTGDFELIIKILEIIIILRGFRLLKLFNEVPQWKIITRTISSLIRPFTSLLLVIFTLFLVFSQITDRAFGGLASIDEKRILRDQSVPDIYIEMNFNDLVNSFVTLFTLMVVNNWFVIVRMYESVTNPYFARLFFVTFYFLSVIVVLNIVVAFAIDMYGSVDSLYRDKKDIADNQMAENMLSDDEDPDYVRVNSAFALRRQSSMILKQNKSHRINKYTSDLVNYNDEPKSKF